MILFKTKNNLKVLIKIKIKKAFIPGLLDVFMNIL